MATPEENRAGLYKAFSAVLSQVPNFVTDSQGQKGNRKYGYLTLNTLLTKIKPIFTANGLGIYQQVDYETTQDKIVVATVKTIIFSPETGESLQIGSFPTVMNANPQDNGSAVTYARRYALFACLGIYPDQDDDGQSARDYYAGHPSPEQQAPWQANHEKQPEAGGITEQAAKALSSLAHDRGMNLLKMATQLKGHQVTKLRQLTPEDGKKLTAQIIEMTGNAPQQA